MNSKPGHLLALKASRCMTGLLVLTPLLMMIEKKGCYVEIWDFFELPRRFCHSFEVGALSVIELFDL